MGVYNGARYLRESIRSVLDQQGIDFEFIIVNDGSEDETEEILLDYAAQDRRLRVLNQSRLGLTKALIRGCEHACGEFIARQDNGDSSLPGRLLAQAEVLDCDKRLTFVSCWTEFCGPEGEYLSVVKGRGVASTPRDVISLDAPKGVVDGPTHHASVMLRRDAYRKVGGYRREFYFGQDWDLWYRLAEAGRFQMMEQVLYRARVMPNSISSRYRTMQERFAALSYQAMLRRQHHQSDDDLLKLAQSIRPPAHSSLPASSNAGGLYFIGEQLRRNGDKRAEKYFLESLRASPLFLKAWLRLAQIRVLRRP